MGPIKVKLQGFPQDRVSWKNKSEIVEYSNIAKTIFFDKDTIYMFEK